MERLNQHGLEPRIQLNIRIDREDKEALERMALQDRQTLSEYIRTILHDHVKHNSER